MPLALLVVLAVAGRPSGRAELGPLSPCILTDIVRGAWAGSRLARTGGARNSTGGRCSVSFRPT
eukprot:6540852-Pyramimonas_sp.AAC.1